MASRGTLFGVLALAAARPPTHEMRAAYEHSIASCRHGHSGLVLVKLHEATTAISYLSKLRANQHKGDEFHHHYMHTMNAVAAKLSAESLSAVFEDEHALSVHADCIVKLNLPRQPVVLAASPPRTPAADGRREVDGAAVAGVTTPTSPHRVAAGVEARDARAPQYWNWGIDRIDSLLGRDDMYRFGNSTGKGTRLYHLDTGIFAAHEDFGGRVVPGYSAGCPTGKERGCGSQWLYQGVIRDEHRNARSKVQAMCDGHGTHTASIAAGSRYGVAKDATIVAVQSLDCNGSASDARVFAAYEWVIADAMAHAQPAVVTLSLGGDYSPLLNAATELVVRAGIPVVASAGNDGHPTCEDSPASDPSVISVGAIDSKDRYAAYSNFGSCTTIFAPGSDVIAAYPVTGSTSSAAVLSGTSMAAPHVAGAVLQLLQSYPHLTPNDVMRSLICMASKEVIQGLDAYSPNRLLHTGAALADPQNRRLLSAQQHPRNEVEGVSEDATMCHQNGFGPARGYVVPEGQRAREDADALPDPKSALAPPARKLGMRKGRQQSALLATG
jgi:subtilisin family serine protease